MKSTLIFLLLASSVSFSRTDFNRDSAVVILKTLSVDIGPRPMGSPAEQRALVYAVRRFMQAGCDTAYVIPMMRSSRANTQSGVAVGIKRGATNRIIVLGGHIDSAGPEIPGADDDGSGSAVVMELARVFCQRSNESTLVFACFGGEEQGLEGSEFFVREFPDIDSVVLMLQVDMANGLGIIDIDGDTHGISAPKWLICAAYEEFEKLGYENLRYPTHFFAINYAMPQGSGSDHEPFLKKGIPAVDFSTDVTKPIHTPQDHFENFDVRGLQRSGDLIVKLVERFDGGVPDGGPGNYWLFVVGNVRIFVAHWVIRVFVGVALVCTILAFLATRRRRIFPLDVRWSGLKMFLYTMIVVFFAWISSDVVGILKGYRYPWMTEVSSYFLLAMLFILLGIWVSVRIANRLRLSHCPYVYFKRSAVILTIYLLLLLWGDIELAIYPASLLFLLSIAIIVSNKMIKIVLALLSPLLMIRLMFNEWGDLFYRTVASGGMYTASFPYNLLYNGGMILLLCFYFYPLILGLIAVYRDTTGAPALVRAFRSRASGIAIGIAIAVAIAYLYPREVYSEQWYRTVHVGRDFSVESDSSRFVRLRSAEYLDGVRIVGTGVDTTLVGRITEARIPIPIDDKSVDEFVTARTVRTRSVHTVGDTTFIDLLYDLTFSRRPYTVELNYSADGTFQRFASPWLFTTSRDHKVLQWYSFPPDSLSVPIQLAVVGTNSVTERFEFVYNSLGLDWSFEREQTNFILRTKQTGELSHGDPRP
jgi:hypothetical protein